MRNKTQTLAVLAVITASVIGGVAPVIAKVALQTFTPLQIVFFRFGGAGIVLACIATLQKLSWRMPLRELLKLLVGSLLFAGNIILFIYGISRTTSVVSQLLYLLTPFVVMFWGKLIFHTSIPVAKAMGAGIGLFGALLLVLGSVQNVSLGTVTGNLLVAAAVVCWGSYLLYSQKITHRYSPLQLLTTNSVVTGLLATPIVLRSFAGEQPLLQPLALPAILAILLLVVVNSIIMFFLFQWALKRVSAVTVSTSQYLNPLVAAIFGAIILQESISIDLLLSSVLILVGVYFSMIYADTPKSWPQRLYVKLFPKVPLPPQLS